MHTASPARARARIIAVTQAALLVVGIAATALVGGGAAAVAAPTVTYPNAISNIQLTRDSGAEGPLNQWELARITADWSVPDGAVAGQTFGMTLPVEFSRYGSGEFDVIDPDTNLVVATCEVSQGGGPEVVCTLTNAVNGQLDIGGSFWMSVQATQATAEESVQFDVGGQFVVVDLPGTGGIIPEDLTAPATPYKYSDATDQVGVMSWTVGIPGQYVSDGAFTVSDQLDPTQENHHYTGDVALYQRAVQGGQLVGDWTVVDPANYSIQFAADMKSFAFEAHGVAGGDTVSYRLSYLTQADGVVQDGDVFGNGATVGSTTVTTTHEEQSQGGGTGSGTQYTRFTVTKALAGEQAELARDAVFSVRYYVAGAPETAKTMSVRVGQPARSDRAPLGSTFVIEEVDLPTIDGVTWGEWTLTGDGVTANGDGTYSVTPTSDGVALTLTNTAAVAAEVLGSVSWTKVDPAGGALAGSEWTLTPAGGAAMVVVDGGASDTDPAAGSLRVAGLTPGTYTLAETKAPAGYVATTRTFTIVVDEEDLAVSAGAIVNERAVSPTPTPTGTETQPPAVAGSLAVTGGTSEPWLALGAGGLGLVLAGLALHALNRARRTV